MRYIKQRPRELPVPERQTPRLTTVPQQDPGGHTTALIGRLEGQSLLRAIYSPDEKVRLSADRSPIANENTRSAQEFLAMRNERLRAAASPRRSADPPARNLFLVPFVATVLPMPAFTRSHSILARR